MTHVEAQQVFDCISRFRGVDDARTLYCNVLNYEYQDLPIPVDDWSKAAKEIVIDAKIIAKKSGFYILYVTIRRLTRTNERTVLKELLNKGFPDCAVIFTDEDQSEFHITSPKYEPESRYKFVVRRYVVGTHERLRTASERLCLTYALDGDTTTELKAKHDEAFNVEAVTKEFYDEYKTVLNAIEQKLLAQGIGDKKTAKGFAQQFLNRLMFLYFIQKKGWLNNDGHFVWNLVRRYKKLGRTPRGIYKDWIEPLFFYAFNHKAIPDSYENLPTELRAIFEQMPYLNGGLFLKNELDACGYQLDDSVVFKVVDDLLERFNFTISEDTPFDIDVAVDPQMLGKVYESLIFEEERGEAGIFYTPRIEVDFMCRQSLLEYLIEHTGIPQDKLISFLYALEEDRAELLSEEEAQKIGNALYRAQIVDPACGSGAFLVGMLHVLMELYTLILKRLKRSLNLFRIKKEIIQHNLYGVDIKDWAVRVAELRLWLTLLVETPESEIEFDANKPLLPNLTLKLRCGDSLVQEIGGKPLRLREFMRHLDPICRSEIKELYADLKKAKEEYYYSRADDPEVLAKIKKKEVEIIKRLVDSEIKLIDFKLRPLAATQQRFDSTQMAITVSELKRAEDRDKLVQEKMRLQELLKTLESADVKQKFFWEIDFAEVFADGGFDIVIANPPYVRQEKIAPLERPEAEITTEVKKAYKDALVRSVIAQWGDEYKKDLKSDLYVYFYYHGLSVLKPGGVFCFISSNSWLDVGFGAKLQEFLLRNIEVKAIYDNHAKRSFEEASINTIIALFKRPADETNLWNNVTRFVAFKKPFKEVITVNNLQALATATEKLTTEDFRCIPLTQGELWKEGIEGAKEKQTEISGSAFIGTYVGNKWGGKYLRAPDIFFTILEKGKGKLVRLGDIAEVRRGFTTGANEFFYLDEEAQKKWQIEKEFLKPVIKSPKECDSLEIDPAKLKLKAFICKKDKPDLRGSNALKYIENGEEQIIAIKRGSSTGTKIKGYQNLETIKNRIRWYELPELPSADVLFRQFFNEIFNYPINPNGYLTDHTFYYIHLHDKSDLLKFGLILNSTISCLFTELYGRRNLGEGVLTTYGPEMKPLPVIKPDFINGNEIRIFNILAKRRIKSIFEECGIDPSKPIREQEPNPLPDRAELDNIIFDELGLTPEERKEVYWSVCELVKQRLEKARSV